MKSPYRKCRHCRQEHYEHRSGGPYDLCPKCRDDSMPLSEKVIVVTGVIGIVLIVVILLYFGKV